jgi:hypothetical protein
MKDPVLEDVEWKVDCQGKQDFDAKVVCLFTRFYPQGGGFSILRADRTWEENGDRPEVKPSATCCLVLGDGDTLIEREFEGETEEEVKAQAEAWAAAQITRVRAAMVREFMPSMGLVFVPGPDGKPMYSVELTEELRRKRADEKDQGKT